MKKNRRIGIMIILFLIVVTTVHSFQVHKRNSTVEFITYEDYYDDNYDAWEVTGRPVTEFKNMYKDMLYAWETYEVPSMERELYVFIIIDVILIVVLGITLIVSRRDEGASM